MATRRKSKACVCGDWLVLDGKDWLLTSAVVALYQDMRASKTLVFVAGAGYFSTKASVQEIVSALAAGGIRKD